LAAFLGGSVCAQPHRSALYGLRRRPPLRFPRQIHEEAQSHRSNLHRFLAGPSEAVFGFDLVPELVKLFADHRVALVARVQRAMPGGGPLVLDPDPRQRFLWAHLVHPHADVDRRSPCAEAGHADNLIRTAPAGDVPAAAPAQPEPAVRPGASASLALSGSLLPGATGLGDDHSAA